MFKQQRQKRNSKHTLIEDHSKKQSAFKDGTIEMTFDEIMFIKLNKLNELSGIPKPKQQFRIVTQKAINSYDFILAILANEEIEELIVAFYRIGKKVIQDLVELQKQNKINKIHFLVNDAVPKLTPDAYNLMKSVETKNFKIRLENNHTKIILIKTKFNHYVIEGSGNLSINARIEQYSFDNNKSLFNFHKTWITSL